MIATNLAAQEVPYPRIENVIIVSKTHLDVGYHGRPQTIVDRYRTDMIDQALAICDETRALSEKERFRWTLPAWVFGKLTWSGQEPAHLARLEAAIRDDLLVWHALPFTVHTEATDLESLARGLGHATRLSMTYGKLPVGSRILPGRARHANPGHSG